MLTIHILTEPYSLSYDSSPFEVAHNLASWTFPSVVATLLAYLYIPLQSIFPFMYENFCELLVFISHWFIGFHFQFKIQHLSGPAQSQILFRPCTSCRYRDGTHWWLLRQKVELENWLFLSPFVATVFKYLHIAPYHRFSYTCTKIIVSSDYFIAKIRIWHLSSPTQNWHLFTLHFTQIRRWYSLIVPRLKACGSSCIFQLFVATVLENLHIPPLMGFTIHVRRLLPAMVIPSPTFM